MSEPVAAVHVALVAPELRLAPAQVRAVAELLAEGATVPFIARYRKERTGSLDEVAVTTIRHRLAQLADRFVADPATVVKVQQTVQVTVLEVDRERRRISLSMKTRPNDGKGG